MYVRCEHVTEELAGNETGVLHRRVLSKCLRQQRGSAHVPTAARLVFGRVSGWKALGSQRSNGLRGIIRTMPANLLPDVVALIRNKVKAHNAAVDHEHQIGENAFGNGFLWGKHFFPAQYLTRTSRNLRSCALYVLQA